MRTGGLLLFLLFNAWIASAQINGYGAAAIPMTVKKNASKVMRFETIGFDVTDIDHARLDVHRIITILNEKGQSALTFIEGTDKFTSLEDVDIKLYDSTGKILSSHKQKDLTVLALGEGLIDDSKMNFLEMNTIAYPVTIEYKYSMRYKGILSYPSYRILVPDEGVESSTYIARVRKEVDLRYREKNISLPPSVTDDGKYKSYTWSVKNLSPVTNEEGAVSYESRFPSILLAPNHFRLDDYEGDMTSWDGFGKWYADLQKGMDVLPEERKVFFRSLVGEAKDDRAKTRIIYKYLQENFRYVAIELGIGGYKPFPADFTDKKKYGDCKALSNYMQAVLQSIGIKSYQALVNAEYNSEPVDPSFPCNLFDHVILCVPQQKDSIWLECTSRSSEFGELGNFTENRNALLITERGGVLVPTPKSRPAENAFNALTRVDIKEDGSGKTSTILESRGEYKQDMMHISDEKSDDRKNYTIDELGFKDPGDILFPAKALPGDYKLVINQDLESVPEAKTGNKMFLPVRVYKLWSKMLPGSEDRRQDFYFGCPFEKTDTTIFHLPDGYFPDALPAAKNSKSDFASYTTRYWYDEADHQVYSTAKIVLTQYKIPVRSYAAVKDFFDAILRDGSERIVIKRQ